MIDIVATLTRSEADIQVVHEAYGGMRYSSRSPSAPTNGWTKT